MSAPREDRGGAGRGRHGGGGSVGGGREGNAGAGSKQPTRAVEVGFRAPRRTSAPRAACVAFVAVIWALVPRA
jgi:hypothetical protein